MNNYRPISCTFYDVLEAAATLRREIRIRYYNNDLESVVEGAVEDLYIKDKAEFLLLNSGLEIRLDQLIAVDDYYLADFC